MEITAMENKKSAEYQQNNRCFFEKTNKISNL